MDVDVHRKCTYGKCAHLPKWLGKVHIIVHHRKIRCI